MNKWVYHGLHIVLMAVCSAAIAGGFQLLLIPEGLLSGGLSGVAMVVGYITDWNIGWLYFALNVPVLMWGLRALGRRFIVYSIASVACTSLFMQVIPVWEMTDEPVLAAVFGGILVGTGTGISLRYGDLRADSTSSPPSSRATAICRSVFLSLF